MNLRAYKLTGRLIDYIVKLLRANVRVTGLENLTSSPTLFKVNHFTRSETVLVPYVLFKYANQRIVRSLATHSVFFGWLGRYLRTIGVMSVRHPSRNKTIVKELLSGERDWVIYPEGGIVKNRKTVRKGKLHLTRPSREGPPHTGAAMLALKAETIKERYQRAWARSDRERIAHYRKMYGIAGPNDLNREETVVVPVSITYHRMRSGRNALSRLATRLSKKLDPRLFEELLVEGKLLLSRPDINIHFGKPIPVRQYLNRRSSLTRGLVGLFSESRQEDVGLRNPARRLTQTSMRRLYQNMEVNLEHLFCAALRVCGEEVIDAAHFRRALFLAAMELREQEGVRLHPRLRNGISRLITDKQFEPLDKVLELAGSEGIVRVENGHYLIDREALDASHDFHEIRLRGMVQVIANELEPNEPAIDAVRRAVLGQQESVRDDVSRHIRVTDRQHFHEDYARFYREGVSKPAEYGEPYFLEGEKRVGVLLVHGYLACPEQMRPLGDALHAQGHTVYGVRLAGHGAVPEAMQDVEWREWLYSVSKGYAALETSCDRVFLVGFSLGGLMSMLLAAGRDQRVDGVVSINAPLRLRDPRARFVPLIAQAGATLRRLGLTGVRPYRSHHGETPELSYGVDYLGGLREVQRAIAACRSRLPKVSAPTLVVQSRRDPIIHSSSARIIERRIGADRCELHEVSCDHHLVLRGDEAEAVFARIHEFIVRTIGERDAPTLEAALRIDR